MGVQDRCTDVVAEDVWVPDTGVDLDPRRTKGVVFGKDYCQMKYRVSLRRQDETSIGQILVIHLKLDVRIRILLELLKIGAQARAEVSRGHCWYLITGLKLDWMAFDLVRGEVWLSRVRRRQGDKTTKPR